ncbi:MAG: hypothetical protein IT521_07395 [Burkholderiales bacterium]|nr:hypothetical protein [Burkholderiales bacterium]
MADFPAPQSAPGASTVPVTAGVLAYALYAIAAIIGLASSGLPLIAPLTGVLGIIGVIVCYVKKDDAAGTWVASHFTWLIRTFWWSLLWAILGWVVFFTLGLILIGIPIALAIWFFAGLWVIYRVLRGYLLYKESRPIPGV